MPFKKGGGHHRGRKSTRISLTNTRTPTPKVAQDDSDEEMNDADVDATEIQDEPVQDEGDEEAATPAADDDEEEEEDDDSPPKITTIPRRRGRGGRGRGRIDRHHSLDREADGSESGTPMRRRRGRPPGSGLGRGRGGFRGRRKGVAPETPRTITDKEGNTVDVVDDEAQIDDDPEGNTKVDAKGNLQGGREYRVRTFTIMNRDERLYMLSTEPARCCGFRDSYLFFTKHPKLFKVLISEEEKMDLISREILPNSYKGRNIGVVTARSVFREFGARIIVGGRKVIDDYKVAEARANGEVEGELADPDDIVPANISDYNRNRYVAWFGASEVYRTAAAGMPAQPGKAGPLGKRRNNITLENWQYLHAAEAGRFNSTLTALRQANLDGVYDNNTNMVFYPKIMQPTHARWEYIAPGQESSVLRASKALSNGHLTNGAAANGHSDEVMDIDGKPSQTNGTHPSGVFTPVPPVVARNFAVLDVSLEAPPVSNVGFPGPDGVIEDPTSGATGLGNISQELIDELPADCRAAFEEARALELRWKHQWGTDAHSGHRGSLKIGYHGYPV